MKKSFLIVMFIGLALSACSSHNFYDRANSASEKSLESLERDTK